ncbi:MAG: hypothetical protein PF447_14480 [Spirochaetaceae bacterium]|nr:hypothetical protein [Spirochaetaceae bacterium]
MKKNLILLLIGLIFIPLTASPGQWRSLGNSGDWVLTIAGATLNGSLYTAESSGYLYETNLQTGQWREISSGYASTTFMFAWDNWLYTMETDGSLYKVNPSDGSWQQLGQSGDWALTIAGVIHQGKLYTAESSGYLYVTDLSTGQWREISSGYGNTMFMFSKGNRIYTIETDGTLYEINPSDGSWVQKGPSGAWELTLAGAVQDGRLFTAESSGYLYWTDLSAGSWTEISSSYGSTEFMFAANDLIYTIETDGSLYEVQVK